MEDSLLIGTDSQVSDVVLGPLLYLFLKQKLLIMHEVRCKSLARGHVSDLVGLNSFCKTVIGVDLEKV